jgi:hypothetical protein
MRDAEMLLLIDAPSPDCPSPFLPSKLIDYLGTGKPVFGITPTNGASARVLRKYNHMVVSPDRPDEIASALEAIPPDRGITGVQSPPGEYNLDTVSAQLVHWLTTAIKRSRSSAPSRVAPFDH